MTTRLPSDHVAIGAKGTHEVCAREIAREPHDDASLRGDDFVANEVQSDHPRAITLVEMAANGVPDCGPEGIEVIGLGHDGRVDAGGDVAPLGILGHDEQDLSHVRSSSDGGSLNSLRVRSRLGESQRLPATFGAGSTRPAAQPGPEARGERWAALRNGRQRRTACSDR